jgi:hypothetical protein
LIFSLELEFWFLVRSASQFCSLIWPLLSTTSLTCLPFLITLAVVPSAVDLMSLTCVSPAAWILATSSSQVSACAIDSPPAIARNRTLRKIVRVRMFVLLVISLPQAKPVSRSCPYISPARRDRTPARTSMRGGRADKSNQSVG